MMRTLVRGPTHAVTSRSMVSAGKPIEFPDDECVEVTSDETLDRSVELGSLECSQCSTW